LILRDIITGVAAHTHVSEDALLMIIRTVLVVSSSLV
jgi:hypothetical protein